MYHISILSSCFLICEILQRSIEGNVFNDAMSHKVIKSDAKICRKIGQVYIFEEESENTLFRQLLLMK